MSVRRLAPKELQPASFTFSEENVAFARNEIAKYPPGRQASAAIAILWRVQEQHEGWVSEAAIRTVADLLEMPYIRMLEIATFYTMFQLSPVGKKAHVQVCGTTPCRLRGAADIIELCLRQRTKTRAAERPAVLRADYRANHAEGDDMRRDSILMKNWRYIALHAALAACFIFLLQRYALNASLETSLVWAATLGACAAGLAYSQSNR
jgi:NADH:ubiquinone oxidoreductase subunit E